MADVNNWWECMAAAWRPKMRRRMDWINCDWLPTSGTLEHNVKSCWILYHIPRARVCDRAYVGGENIHICEYLFTFTLNTPVRYLFFSSCIDQYLAIHASPDTSRTRLEISFYSQFLAITLRHFHSLDWSG